ncbi:MAG: BamA/TamA family outer membrane protein [Deltaproteobacteria bacterium]|nr:BamA/TamA family outer membrane protein [Deltaproteobacteria bacterium]
MSTPLALLVSLALAQVPLVAPPDNQPPEEKQKPAQEPKKTPAATPPAEAPAAPAPKPPLAQPPPAQGGPVTSGSPLVDRLLQLLPQEPQEDTTNQWPVLQPGDPRPVISFRFDYEDWLNATYFREETLRSFVQHPLGVPVQPAAVNADARYVAQQYKLRGYSRAAVKWGVEQTDRGDVIVFAVSAGSRGQLKQVDTSGNVKVPTEALIQGLFHRPLNVFALLNFADRGGVYHAGYIEQDIRQVQKNYADHGYLAAQVLDARIFALDAEGKDLRLVFDVRDGALFHMGLIRLSGQLPVSERDCRSLLGMNTGSPAELRVLDAGVERILDEWRNRGFANARATQERRVRETQHLLDVMVKFEKGPVTRVGQIRVVGDPTTSDHVIKRDVAVREGQVYSLRALKLTEERLMYTGLFTKVTARPVTTPDPSVVDVEVEVVEQQSWYFSIAPSWIPGEGLVGLGFVGFRNLWLPDLWSGSIKPRGQALRLNAQGILSQRRQTGRVDVEDPRFLDTRLSVGGNVHRDRYVYPEFSQVRTGGAIQVGYPLIEYTHLSMGYGLERVDFDASGPIRAFAGSARFPDHKRRASLRLDAAYDRRDNVLFPTRGLLLSASVEYGSALLLGEMSFMTVSANARFYFPMPFGFVLKNNTAGAVAFDPHGGVIPVSERFYEGGPIQSVRGYLWQSISPVTTLGDPTRPDSEQINVRLGGNTRLLNNLELETPPIPIFPMLPLKLFVFLDAGNTWSEKERPFFLGRVRSLSDVGGMVLASREGVDLPLGMFYSVGVGGMLATALFPLRIDFTVPLTRRPQDELVNFFVSAGSPF